MDTHNFELFNAQLVFRIPFEQFFVFNQMPASNQKNLKRGVACFRIDIARQIIYAQLPAKAKNIFR